MRKLLAYALPYSEPKLISKTLEVQNLELRSHRSLELGPRYHATMTVSISSLMQAGSNFRAMYVVDWDKENYFSVLNVRRRKFEKERMERQLQAEAERVRKQEIEARQAEFARAEAEKLKMEQMAAALRCLLDFLDINLMPSEFELLMIIMARV
jgi:hypothetical protein